MDNESELTEAELNKIFFGSNSTASGQPVNNPVEQKQPSGGPKKLKRVNEAIVEKVIEQKITNEIEAAKINDPPISEEPKKPQGRPKKWTEEKIKQLKEEKKRLAAQRKVERADHLRLGKLGSNDPLISKYESDKLIDTILKSKQEVEELVSQKRQETKDILKNDTVNFYSRRDTCRDHSFKFARYTLNGVLGTCKTCSAEQEFDGNEWKLYIIRNRSKL